MSLLQLVCLYHTLASMHRVAGCLDWYLPKQHLTPMNTEEAERQRVLHLIWWNLSVYRKATELETSLKILKLNHHTFYGIVENHHTFYGIVEYPRSTIILCVLYTHGNTQKLAEWVKNELLYSCLLKGQRSRRTDSSASCHNWNNTIFNT